MHAVPAVLADLLDSLDAAAPMRTAVVAGTRLPADVGARATTRGIAVTEYYGAAELSFVAAARHPGVNVDVLVRHGPVARAVVEVAAELDADLVVVGRRGSGGFRGLLLGSVSRRVVEHDDETLRARLGREASERARQRFDREVWASGYLTALCAR